MKILFCFFDSIISIDCVFSGVTNSKQAGSCKGFQRKGGRMQEDIKSSGNPFFSLALMPIKKTT
tara:strand:- start:86 stop:277 length:192 start_codon:yes stop_codon:yes gene_type:complete